MTSLQPVPRPSWAPVLYVHNIEHLDKHKDLSIPPRMARFKSRVNALLIHYGIVDYERSTKRLRSTIGKGNVSTPWIVQQAQ